jgi:hypothetical protein
MSKRREICINMNVLTGRIAKQMTEMRSHNFPGSILIRAVEKAITMVVIEKKRVKRPIIIFLGNDLRKSSSA